MFVDSIPFESVHSFKLNAASTNKFPDPAIFNHEVREDGNLIPVGKSNNIGYRAHACICRLPHHMYS